ncbi:hypothetical protein J8281_00945 [Aquimarina sp. U1-2]|uniref:hypothetical protein n=1 Tax=Aquimarina sp. U1-2 TaxID=2823141 RepID=UPI001AECF673|nr:hypothetical protein [Aquimarina sp. U1-2]MBP2830738.1 hypothetical protein [Aquimarina sp. U1-2]
MNTQKAIVNLKFKSNLSIDRLNEISEDRKDVLKSTKGLISVFCYTNEETKTIGGTFIFESIQLAHQYLGQFLTNGLGPKYGILPMTLKIDVGCLKEIVKGTNFNPLSDN